MNKLDNIIVILSCIFMGSCFTTSPDKAQASDKTFEQCVAADENPVMDDCMKLKCWDFWVKNYYKGAHKTPQLHAIERVYDVSFRCHEEM